MRKKPDIEEQNTMPNEIPAQIYEIRDRILSCIEAEQVILFGSYAYGTPRKDSDYDFYVVLPDDFPLRPLDAMRTIRRNLGDTHLVPVDIIANYKNRYEALSQLPTLARTIADKGVILYDRNNAIYPIPPNN